jgi:predicted RNA binding protein YcfA (HicA-like mRNA interferase family)
VKRQKLEKVLKEHGCKLDRQGSKHEVWVNGLGESSTVPRHKEIKKNTAKSIFEALGIDPNLATN